MAEQSYSPCCGQEVEDRGMETKGQGAEYILLRLHPSDLQTGRLNLLRFLSLPSNAIKMQTID